ncbi:MAG: hypothetical protein GC150_17425 [Rhizobiales bacterium]|nr:hypothetical protein [Hyphomicrobiales bacterium]
MLHARSIAIASLIGALSCGIAFADQPGSNIAKWAPWLEVGGYASNTQSRGEVAGWAPLWQQGGSLAFIDARGRLLEGDVQEGNLAVGYRVMHGGGWNLGVWVGFDHRHTRLDSSFNQVAFGLEALHPDFDIRANGYVPTNERDFVSQSSSFAALLSDTSLFIQQTSNTGWEYALRGFDAEVGVRVPLELFGIGEETPFDYRAMQSELRLYAGGFWFDQDEFRGEIAGPRARTEWRMENVLSGVPGSRLTADARYEYDDVRKDRFEAGLRLRLPFGGADDGRFGDGRFANLTAQERRMSEGVVRDADIITSWQVETTLSLEGAEDALTGVDFDRVAFVSAGGSVTNTSNAAGANSLIIVNGTVVGSQTLQGNQTLQGGGSTIRIRGLDTGTELDFTAPGAAGALTAPAVNTDNLLLGGSNTHVSGLEVVGSGPGGFGDGVDVGSDKSNIFLTNLQISNTGGDGVDIDDNNQLFIINVSTSMTGESGIDINNGNTVSIQGGTLASAGDDGLSADDDNSFTVAGLMITSPSDRGIDIGDNNTGTFTGVSITDALDDAVHIDDDNTFTFAGLTVDGAGDDALEVGFDNTVTISNSTVRNTDFGIFANGIDNTITVTNTRFSDITFDAVLDSGFGNSFHFDGVTFRDIGAIVIDLNPNATLFVANTTFAGVNGGPLFRFFGGPTTVQAGSIGNTNLSTNNPLLCSTDFGGSFTGTISFVDGTILQDNILPCN